MSPMRYQRDVWALDGKVGAFIYRLVDLPPSGLPPRGSYVDRGLGVTIGYHNTRAESGIVIGLWKWTASVWVRGLHKGWHFPCFDFGKFVG